MANDPLPGQLTVEALLECLKDAHPGAVVGLSIPPGCLGNPTFEMFSNLRIVRVSPAVILLGMNSQIDEPLAPPTKE